MQLHSVLSRDWKTTLKTVLGIFSLFAIVLILPMPTEAVTEWKRAVVRANDGHVYEIQYTKPLNIENFSIRGLDGTTPSHEITAEFYIAAGILNRPPTASDVFSGRELVDWVDTESKHTATQKRWDQLAKIIGSVSLNGLTSLLSSGEIVLSLVETPWVQYAIQGLTTITILVGDEKLASEAYTATRAFAVRSVQKRYIFDKFVASVDNGTEVSIDDIKSAYNALLEADYYVRWVGYLMRKHLIYPGREERLVDFVLTVNPLTSLGYFFLSAGKNIEDLENVRKEFFESGNKVATKVSADIDTVFSEAAKSKVIWDLASAGFFDREPPTIADFIEDMQLTVDDGLRLLDLTTKFNDLNGDRLEHTVEVTDKNVAEVKVIFEPDGELVAKPFLEITPKRVGSTLVTIEATDPTRLSATQTFTVTVEPAEAPNQPPRAVNKIPSQSLTMGSAPPPLDVSVYFHDPDGDMIFYTPVSSDRAVATTEPTGSEEITIFPRGIGTATITVTAKNSDGLFDTQIFSVTVTATQTPTERPTPQGLSVGDSVIVQKTIGLGLNIRNDPWVPAPGSPDNDIGQVYDGATGIIRNGPEPDTEGRTWWHVEWDASNKVQWKDQPADNRGWSVEAIGEVGLLARRPSEPATQISVPVIDDTIDESVDPSDPPDLVIANISVDYDTMYPGEGFTVSVTVRNAGGQRASNVRLRYYRSSDRIYSTDDEEIVNTDDFIGGLDGGEIEDEDAHLDAPSEPGVYYYIARVARVAHERDTANNYESIKITVLPPAAPDYVIVSLTSNRYLVDPGRYFRLDATVLNQGEENARETTTVRFYRSLDPIPSPDDEEVRTDTIRALRDGKTDYGVRNGPAPEQPGAYYYYACVDAVSDERNTDNNCSNVVTINVRGPDLVVNSVSVDYHSRTNTVSPEGIFELEATIRNQGTEDADDTTLHYYISRDPMLSSDDTEVDTDRVFSLDENETSKIYKSDVIRVPYTSGFFYALVCVDGVEGETNTENNCYTPIKITVRNFGPRAEGTIPVQTLAVGASTPLDVSAYFTDTNNDNLTYRASSSAPNIVTVRVSGAHVTIGPQRTGSATVTVTASDGEFTTTQTFTVSVVGEETWMPDASLRAAVRTALDLTPDDVLTQQAMEGLIILNAASSTAGTGVQDLTGLEHATQLTILNLGRSGVSDLTPLQGLTQLTQLNLIYTEIWDLSPLQGLTNLTNLNLLQTSPRSISPLQGLINLTSLNLGRARVRDLTPLQGLTGLTDLDLSFNNANNFTNPGDLTPLSGLTALTSLNLGHTTISDITPLKGLTGLTDLDLKNNKISDISPVSGLTQLVRLYLDGNQISDVSPLEGLTSLQLLRLKYNPITDTAPLQRLKAENPTVSIDVDIETKVSDLFVDSVRVNKTTVSPSETFRLDAVVKNDGEADASNITLRYYQSTDAMISETDTQLKTSNLGLIGVDAMKEPWAQLTAPETPGVYYYGICVDAVANESDTANNCSTAVVVTVLGADLVINSVRVEKPTASLGEKSRLTAGVKDRGEAGISDTPDRSALSMIAPGDQFRLNAVLQNRGKAASTDTTLRYYLSVDDTISPEDMEVHTATLPIIAADAMREPSVQLTAPDAPGVYYYGVCVDAVEGESDTNNNCSTAVAVTVENTGRVDFVVESVRASKTTVKPGENFQISAVIRNQGEIAATATPIRYYLSTDEDITTADTEMHTATLPRVAADATRQQARQFTAPDTPGTYYYGVCVDAVEGESDTANNCSDAVAVTVGGADLMIDGTPQVSKTTLSPGETFQINTRVWNQGSATSDATTLRYYLSTDETISAEDTEVDSDNVATLSGKGAHASRRRAELSKTLTAPDTPGTHYYGVCVDSVAGDANIVNNCSQAIVITVESPPEPVVSPVSGESENLETVEIQGPDLIISAVRVDASTIKIGGGVRFHLTLTNQGTSKAPATIIRYYRSSDATITAEDTELRAVPVGELGAGKSYTTWALLPSAFSVGTYYYGACLDGVASEFDTANNCSDALEITVETQGNPLLVAVGTISTQALTVGGTPKTLNVSGNFVGKVETWTASSSKPSVVTASMSGSSVILTPVNKGWGIVTIEAFGGKLTAKHAFLVSVSGDAVYAPDIPDISGPDLSPEVSMPDANLRTAVRETLGLEVGTPITQRQMARLAPLTNFNSKGINDLTGLEHAANVRDLHLYSNQISDITPLANLTNLTGLHLYQNQISDITPLANLTNLTQLDLRESPINDFTPLGNLTKLTKLLLDGTQISDLTPLRNLTALQVLFLNRNQISDVTPLANLTNLTQLQLTVNQISDAAPLEGLTSLKHLALGRNSVTDLAPLHRLREKNPSVSIDLIKVPDTPEPEVPDTTVPDLSATVPDLSPEVTIPDENLRAAVRSALGLAEGDTLTQQKMAELTKLDAIGNQITDLTGLEYATQLRELNLGSNQVTDITPLQNLIGLTHLLLAVNQISDITPLQNLTNLTYLDLRDLQGGDITNRQNRQNISDLMPLQNLTALRNLLLSFNPISDLTPLQNLTNLTFLYLSGIQTGNITPLQNLTNLRTLRLISNQISDITVLQNLTALLTLQLSGNQISDITPLQNLTALDDLSIASNQISDITPLASLTALTYLHLGYNQITDVTPLQNLTSLTRLQLTSNQIADFAPLRTLKENNPSINIDIFIPPGAPAAPMLPDETALLSNYPNPFNPETWIPYQLAKATDVTLTIYDVRGVVVRRLALGHRPPGFYYSRGRAAHWDGRNEIGEKVASGLYFYTFTAGDFTATQKLLIRK